MQGTRQRQTGTGHFLVHCALVMSLLLALIASPFGSVPASAQESTDRGTQTWEAVKSDFEALTYEDLVRYANPTLSHSAQTLLVIQMTRELGRTPSPSEIFDRALPEFKATLNLEETFNALRPELDVLLPRIIGRANATNASPDRVRQERQALLLGLTYMRHYYSFDLAGQAAFERILNGSNGDSFINLLINIGKAGYRNLLASNSATLYTNHVRVLTGKKKITDFIVSELGTGTSPNEWLRQTSKAVIVDKGTRTLFDKYSTDPFLDDHLLTLLAVKNDSIYVGNIDETISYGLTSTYGASLNEKLERALNEQQAFWAFWKRMTKTYSRLSERHHVVSYDNHKRGENTGADGPARWSPKFGAGTDPGVRDFFVPLGKYEKFYRANGVANGTDIRFWIADALSQGGVNTYTHELTHIYDQYLWFNGNKRRSGVGVEGFARGLYETENNTPGISQYAPYFNINMAYELGENRIQNASPTRFNEPADVQEYMQGLMDVIYSLDAMEALAALKMTNEQKAAAFNKVSLAPISTNSAPVGHKGDHFTPVTPQEMASVRTLHDVVDSGLVSGRLIPKGNTPYQTIPYNEYVIAPLFEPVYAGIQNPDGPTGALTFRRYAHELLAEYGWEKGLIAYVSNQYPTDTAALNAIMPEHQGSMATFKKAMMDRRVAKFKDMKPAAGFANATAMQAAMDAALAQDIAKIQAGATHDVNAGLAGGGHAVRDLKLAIFRSYLTQTNDFRTSIYTEREGKVSQELTATVTLMAEATPRAFAEGDFLFNLRGTDTASKAVKGLPTAPVPATVDGSVNLGTLEFTAPGTYSFSISQVNRAQDKITYDQQEGTAVIEVEWASESADPKAQDEITAAGKDVLRIKSVTLSKNNQPVSKLLYTNTYTPERTETETVEEILIPIEDEIILNAHILAGTPDRILFDGQAGVITKRTVTRFIDGVQDGAPVVTETVTTAMKKRRIERGTKAMSIQPSQPRTGRVTQPLTATVTLTTEGTPRPFAAGDFKVTLTRGAGTTEADISGLPAQPVSVSADGVVDLGSMTFLRAGTFTLVINQEQGTNPRITYDRNPVTVTVRTEWRLPVGVNNGTGAEEVLTVASVTFAKETKTTDQARFNNIYTPVKGTESEKSTEKIAITETVETDPNMLVTAKPIVKEAGVEGVITITRTWTTIDGVRVGEPVVKRETTTDMRPRVIVKGSKQPPKETPDPVTEDLHMVLNLTANGRQYDYHKGDLAVLLSAAPGTDMSGVHGLPATAVPVPPKGKLDIARLTFTKPGTYEFIATQKPGSNPKVKVDTEPVTLRFVVQEHLKNGQPVLVIANRTFSQGGKSLPEPIVNNTYLVQDQSTPGGNSTAPDGSGSTPGGQGTASPTTPGTSTPTKPGLGAPSQGTPSEPAQTQQGVVITSAPKGLALTGSSALTLFVAAGVAAIVGFVVLRRRR